MNNVHPHIATLFGAVQELGEWIFLCANKQWLIHWTNSFFIRTQGLF